MFCSLGALHAAQFDGVRLERFDLAPSAEDGVGVVHSKVLEVWQPSARLALIYSREPLKIAIGGQSAALIRDRVSQQATFSVGVLNQLEVHLRIASSPFQYTNDLRYGDLQVVAPANSAFGDMSLGASRSLWQDSAGRGGVGLTADLFLPTGDADAFTSDGSIGGRLLATADWDFSYLKVAGNAGALIRERRDILSSSIGSAALLSGGVYVPTPGHKALTLLSEVWAAAELDTDAGSKLTGWTMEGMIGGRYALPCGADALVGMSKGFFSAPGTPNFRALAMVSWA
jgi:hypothetical protein